MRYFPFNIEIQGNLLDEFGNGFSYFAYKPFLKYSVLEVVLLRGRNLRGLRIGTEMRDIAERHEIGVLYFNRINKLDEEYVQIELPKEFQSDLTLTKLVATDEDVKAESGLVITGNEGGRIILVASVSPLTTTIRAPFLDFEFKPEYDLQDYAEVSIDG